MDFKQLFRTIKMDIKRVIKLLPEAFILMLIFIFSFGVILIYSESLILGGSDFTKVNVLYYMPDDSKYNDVGLSIISNMESVSESVTLIEVSDIETGYDKLTDGEGSAFIIIPEGFVHSIMYGDNNPIHIVFNSEDSIEKYIVNDLFLSAANLLGTAQASVYAMNDLTYNYGITNENREKYREELDIYNFTYALGRESIYEVLEFTELKKHSIYEQLIASFTIIILFLMCFSLTGFVMGDTDAYLLRLRTYGINSVHVFISKVISEMIVLYSAFIAIFIILKFTNFKPNTTALIGMLPIALLISVIIAGISKLSHSTFVANAAIFISSILLIYLAGGLVPISLLPRFLQTLASYNPMTYLIQYVLGVMY